MGTETGTIPRILAVDDEPSLLELVKEFLARRGYMVDTAEGPDEAIRRFALAPRDYSLVIADLTMPGMRGEELLERLFELNPEIPVLVCSGYPSDPAALTGGRGRRIGFLEKPFLPRMLAEAVAGLLGSRPDAGA